MSRWRGTFRDRILRDRRISVAPWLTDSERAKRILAGMLVGLAQAEVFVADNVAEYLYAGTDQEHWGPADFPCVAPPFPIFWIEWGRPSRVISEVHGEVSVIDTTPAHVGWLFAGASRPDEQPGWHLIAHQFLDVDQRDPLVASIGAEGVLWTTLRLDLTLAADGSIEDLGQPILLWDEDDSEPAVRRLGAEGVRATRDYGLQLISGSLSAMAWPAFLALTFANCRNVPRERVEPPAPIIRRDHKRRREPHRSYHLLDIGPMQRTLGSEGGADTHGVQRALHVCRGHFKTYSEEAPLFGRMTGTWWWNSQLRGSQEAGVVDKDYRIKGGT